MKAVNIFELMNLFCFSFILNVILLTKMKIELGNVLRLSSLNLKKNHQE